MFSGLFQTSYKKINFEDVQYAIKNINHYIIINTLPNTEQDCLIKHTLSYEQEESTINEMLGNYDFNNKKIIVYGKNSGDETAEKKYSQLRTLGFSEIYLYTGGFFEWMLLQDIYGNTEFPTTKKVLDILKYKGNRKISV
jgi:3-mercaptopyruvate sulfurtransferase SseA